MKGTKEFIGGVSCTTFLKGNNKICFLLSGTGYTYDKPVLYYATQVAVERGYDVIQINYSFEESLFKESVEIISKTIYDMVKTVVDEILTKHSYYEIAFIAKSLGTLPIVNHYMQQPMELPTKYINLTPLLSLDECLGNLQKTNDSSLTVIGTADPHYDEGKVQLLVKHEVCIIPKANHSLDIEGNAMESLDNLKRIVEKVRVYLA